MKINFTLFFPFVLFVLLTSCSKEMQNDPQAPTTLRVSLLGIENDVDNIGAERKDPQASSKINNNSNHVQETVIPFSNDMVIRVSMVEEVSKTNHDLNNPDFKIQKKAEKVRSSLGIGVLYGVLVYQDDILVDEKTYVHGNESNSPAFELSSNVDYVFIAYSKNSTSELPVINNKNRLSTSRIQQESGNLLFFKEEKRLNAGSNILSIVLKHKFSQITTTISVGPTFLGSIKSLSGASISGTVEGGALNMLNEAITYSTKQVVKNVDFSSIPGNTASIVSLPTLLISPSITSAKLNITSLTVNDVTNPVEITGLKVNPGKKYNLNLTFDSPCIQDIGGVVFNLSNGNSQTFSAPAADYGFVFNITDLDNSFGMNINNQDLIQKRHTVQTRTRERTRNAFEIWPAWGNFPAWPSDPAPNSGTWSAAELEFENISDIKRQNVRYEDGTVYGNNSLNIWNIKGTLENPSIRVIISKTGQVSLLGSKDSEGSLYNLQLITSYRTAVTTSSNNQTYTQTQTETRTLVEYRINPSINWNTLSANTVIATQSVQGATYMKGSGAGKKKIKCSN